MTTPEIPPNLTDLFQDGVNFLNAHYPKYAHQLKLQGHQGTAEGSQGLQAALQETPFEGTALGHTAAVKSASAKGKERATEANDLIARARANAALMSQQAMLPLSTTAGNHFHRVAIHLDSGEIEVSDISSTHRHKNSAYRHAGRSIQQGGRRASLPDRRNTASLH